MKLEDLTQKEAALVQYGLSALGLYDGRKRGVPGPKTRAAWDAYFSGAKPEPVSLDQKLVSLARAEVGVREEPMDSNRGARVEEYQAATWLKGSGWPWCAAFICWLFKEAGLSYKERPKTAGAWDFENWAKGSSKAQLRKGSGTIKAGDIVIFTFSHIGIAVADEQGGIIETVEGNTDAGGSREGGGVYLKTRRKGQVRSWINLQRF